MVRTIKGFRFLLDTNILSDLVRHPVGAVRDQIAEVGEQAVCTSVIVAAELRFGAKKKQSKQLTRQVESILAAIRVLPFEPPMDGFYAEIRATLESKGHLIGPNDMLIAAHCRTLGVTLVTDNLAEFSRVPGLRVKNWITRLGE